MPSSSAVVAYVPAIHAGYYTFLESYRETPLFVLSSALVQDVPRLDRDIRALSSTDSVAMLQSLRIVASVTELLDPSQLDDFEQIILPDEDVSHVFAETYLINKQVTFVPVFLRWERQISTIEQEIPEYRVRSRDAQVQQHMQEALAEAAKSPDWWRQVGAVVVTKHGEVLRAHNSPLPSHDYTLNTFGDPRSNFDAGEHIELSKCIHAEAKLVADAAKQGVSLNGATWYVTTYTCPPCAKLVATSGGQALYYKDGYSLLDAEDVLAAAGVEIVLVEGL